MVLRADSGFYLSDVLAACRTAKVGFYLLRLPQHWPWAEQLTGALTRLRALPGPAG